MCIYMYMNYIDEYKNVTGVHVTCILLLHVQYICLWMRNIHYIVHVHVGACDAKKACYYTYMYIYICTCIANERKLPITQ